jgi:putative tricarboxylic transport membrane protein
MSREEGSSLVWLGIAILICIGSFRLSLGSFRNPGPGFFPFIAGLIVAVLALAIHLQSRGKASAKETKGPLWADKKRIQKMVFTTLALLAYGVGMDYLGFLVSTFIFLAFLLRMIEPQRWSLVLLESALASGISYLIFDIWLQAQLPKGIFQI